MTWKTYALCAAAGFALLGGAFAAGRYTTPTRVETETVEVVKEVRVAYTVYRTTEAVAERRNVRETTHTERRPDGTEVSVRETVDLTHIDTARTAEGESVARTETARTTDIRTVTEYRRPDWRLTALVGVQLRIAPSTSLFGPVVYGGQLERRIVGPVYLGAWGLSSGVAGASLSLAF